MQSIVHAENKSSFIFARARCKAMIYLQRAMQERESENQDTTLLKNQLLKLKALKDYPKDQQELRGILIVSKAKILKGHLSVAFPNTKFSVRCDFYSGGKTIQVYILAGKTPVDINKVTELYMEKSNNDMADVVEYDRYVEVIDKRNAELN